MSQDFAETMARLQAEYRQSLSVQHRLLEEVISACDQGNWKDHELKEQLRGKAHRIGGAGGSFGFDELSEKAKFLEHMLLDDQATTTDFQSAGAHLLAEMVSITQQGT